MKRKLRGIGIVLLLYIAGSCAKEPVANETLETGKNYTSIEQEVMRIVNEHRASLNLNTLQFNKIAYEYANIHTKYMISKGEINHDHFNARASKMSKKVSAKKISENVAKNFKTAKDAFEEWMSSELHKITIEENFNYTAVSVKKDSDGHYYFTQIFFR
ncbi:MAG: CAP domain-containing protein [Cellulophaga sp.]